MGYDSGTSKGTLREVEHLRTAAAGRGTSRHRLKLLCLWTCGNKESNCPTVFPIPLPSRWKPLPPVVCYDRGRRIRNRLMGSNTSLLYHSWIQTGCSLGLERYSGNGCYEQNSRQMPVYKVAADKQDILCAQHNNIFKFKESIY